MNRYAEAASEGLPLRYVVGFILSLLVLTTAPMASSTGMTNAIVELHIFQLANLDYWKLIDPRMGDVLLACGIVASSVFAERLLSRVLFSVADKKGNYRSIISQYYLKLAADQQTSESRSQKLQLLEGAIKPTAKKFSYQVCFSQLAFICGIALALCGDGLLDLALTLVFFAAALLSTFRAVHLFLAEYYPLIALRNTIQGLPPPVGVAGSDFA